MKGLNGEKLIGRLVQVANKESLWYNYYGYIVHYDGLYHVSGGCISSNETLDVVPVFDRDEFKVIRHITDGWRKVGVHTLVLESVITK